MSTDLFEDERRTEREGGRWRRWSGPLIVGVLSGLSAMLLVVTAVLTLSSSSSGAGAPAVTTTSQLRTYYIAADHVEWNYAPDGRNDITGQPFDDVAGTFTAAAPDRIGTVYTKSLYQEYTDASFHTLKPRPPEWQHLGFLGPVIHAVVGDRVRIVFKNNLDRPVSIHMHGLLYDKGSEGAPYSDGTGKSQKGDDAVPPGTAYTYNYTVPDRAGPGPMEGNSVMWMYHSHTDEVGDTYSGLMGPVIVTAQGQAKPDGTPLGVDREIVSVFQVSDENQSLDMSANLKKLSSPPPDPAADDEFHESNLMHNINGYVYGNQPLGTAAGEGMTVKKGQHVRWYLMGMGTEVDLHTPHWHGNTVLANGMRTDVVSLLPANMITADMTPDNVGTWLFHCHVNDHIIAGMLTRYQVTP